MVSANIACSLGDGALRSRLIETTALKLARMFGVWGLADASCVSQLFRGFL